MQLVDESHMNTIKTVMNKLYSDIQMDLADRRDCAHCLLMITQQAQLYYTGERRMKVAAKEKEPLKRKEVE